MAEDFSVKSVDSNEVVSLEETFFCNRNGVDIDNKNDEKLAVQVMEVMRTVIY